MAQINVTNDHNRPHVVVAGAGFGGLRVARAFGNKAVDVTLVDKNNYHLFQPLLYQVATSTLAPNDIAYPVRATLRSQRNLSFCLSTIESIDLSGKRLMTSNGPISFDYLVLALGGETNFFGIESVERNGFGLKDLHDATAIRNHLLHQFETAVRELDPEKRAALLTFVIVGGGPTGIECAGAISELIRLVLHKDYPTLNVEEVHVILLEAGQKLLAAMPEPLGKYTADVLRRKHVDVRMGKAVERYDGQAAHLKDGSTIPTFTLIWAAGVRASRLLDGLGVEQDRMGRVKVDPCLQIPGHPETFVIGDDASLLDANDQPLPMVAPVAMQQAEVAARNVLHHLNGEPLEVFTYKDPGVMATIGRNSAVAHLGRFQFRGFIAWMMWLGVHIIQLIGFRNRLAVLINWGWSYLFYDRAVRLIGPE